MWFVTVPKVKVNLSLCLNKHAGMKTCLLFNEASRHEDVLGNGGVAPRILKFGTGWRLVVSFTPLPL